MAVRLVSAVLLFCASCTHSQDGPVAMLTSVAPDLTCGSQHSTKISLGGDGFAPLFSPALGGGMLKLPQFTLRRTQDLAGQAANDTLTIPANATMAGAADEEWVSQQSMSFQLCPPGTCSTAMVPLTDLPPVPVGLYDVSVTGASGPTSTLPQSLGLLGPPSLSQVDPDLVCEDRAAQLTLTGDFMMRLGGNQAGRVELGMMAGVTPPTFDLLVDNCRTLPAPMDQKLEACTHATFGVPPAQVRSTSLGLFVVNPNPVDCRLEQDPASPTVSLTFVRSPEVDTISPAKVCPTGVDKMVILSGAGFLAIDGVKPTVTVGTTTITPDALDGCTRLIEPGLREAVLSCTTITFTVKSNSLAPKNYNVTVTNPAPAACDTTAMPVMLTIGAGTC
jgi:hypothetical protein